MSKALVALVNPNKVHPGITPYAIDILTTSLEEDDFKVEVVDLTFKRDTWRSAVREYFSRRSPLLVGITIRNTDTIYPQEQRVFLDEHLEIINELKQLTKAPIIAGGVGFSSMPFALVEYFGIPYGVKGPGELIICELANTLLRGGSPQEVPGLIIYDGEKVEQVPIDYARRVGRVERVNRATAYRRRSGDPWKVDNLKYYELGGLGNILTKNGCSFSCTHCVEPDAKGNRFARREVAAVVDEIEALTQQGVYDLHSTDSEFNLSIKNTKEILREIIARKQASRDSSLHDLRLWIYSQPAPFDQELAVLLAQAGCKGVNLSTDHVRDDILNSWKVTGNGKRYYSFEDVKQVNKWLQELGMLVMIEVMLGMPGETIETVYECIDETLALDATVVGYTFGIRVFPYSPLGINLANEANGTKVIRGVQSNTAIAPIILKPQGKCKSIVEYERQFMFDEFGRFRPLYYFSPDLPEDAETIASPNGRWLKTLQRIWDYIPEQEHHRVMLPSVPGLTKDDNNYADNPFLTCLVQLGYKGAFWSRWRQRDQIMLEDAAVVV
jgi:tryptophan 2-C-methyltransferase